MSSTRLRMPGFIGGSDEAMSKNWNVERDINQFVEQASRQASPKTGNILIDTPGLRVWSSQMVNATPPEVGTYTPIRNLFEEDGRCFAIAGSRFVELFTNGTFTDYSGIGFDARPGTISSNGSAGHQLFIVSAGQGYIFDLTLNTLTEITDTDFPLNAAADGGFLDQYFLVLGEGTNTFHASSLDDGLTWSGLDVGQNSFSSDKTLRMVIHDRLIWLFGSKRTIPWYNSGSASFPFQPVQGVFIEQGILARDSAKSVGDGLYWIGANEDGGGSCYRAGSSQFRPEKISTPSIEKTWREYPHRSDAIAWSYSEDGHSFYLLYFPTGDTTWCYDITTNIWHERAHWRPRTASWVPHVGRCHAFAFGTHLIGDRQSAAIYEQRLDLSDEELVIAA